MQRLAVKAAVTEATDLGQFSAIAAAYSVDRQNEQIRPGAFAATIKAWRASGKDIPLHWDHKAGAESIIGSVDPATMRETDDGLYVEGQLDLDDSGLAREAWRSLKRNRIGLSFGFLTTDAKQRDDGVKELRAIDLFEITLTGAPANSDTRVLSAKLMTVEAKLYEDPVTGRLMNARELREHAKAMAKRTEPIRIVSFEC